MSREESEIKCPYYTGIRKKLSKRIINLFSYFLAVSAANYGTYLSSKELRI
jgi:hypothetical protein